MTLRLCIGILSFLGPLVALSGQVPLIDESFDDDPCETDWILRGHATWVSPDDGECIDPNQDPGQIDPGLGGCQGQQPCSLYPGEGYVLVTPAVGDHRGSAFRTERIEWNDFRMTATVELRDGCAGGCSDGMAIVIVGTEEPPGIPDPFPGGGSMGATGLGNVPTMVFEFDTWQCNTGDRGNDNHLAFAWQVDGFPNVDWIPVDVFVPLDKARYPINNREPAPASPNRWSIEALVKNGTIAFNLENQDIGFPKTRMYTYKIEDFVPFEGYLGVTAATGGGKQNQILHWAKVQALPADFCLDPPASVTRAVQRARRPEESCGDYGPGDVLRVELVIGDLRQVTGDCGAARSIVVREKPPEGWAVSEVSDGGVYPDPESPGAIRWIVEGASLADGKRLTYNVTASDSMDLSVAFSGQVVENVPLSEPVGIAGDETIFRDTPFDACGGIRCWNVLGAFSQLGGNNPGDDNIRLDYLTDGEITELDFVWYPGAQIATVFGGDGVSGAASTGLVGGTKGRNSSGVPEVFAWNDGDGFIDLNEDGFGGDPDNVMAYAQAYVVNTTGAEVQVTMGISSDDSVQVLLNQEEVWIHSVPRGGSSACAPQDVSPDGFIFTSPHVLRAGENSLIVKVFEGGGQWNFALRFQDDLGEPITEGLEVRKVPAGVCIVQPFKATRDIATTETVLIEGRRLPKWSDGETYPVAIALSDIRTPSGGCAAPSAVKVEENVPASWTPGEPSDGGTVAGTKVTWDLTGPQIAAGKVLSYKVKAAGEGGAVTFSGKVTDPVVVSPGAVVGENTLQNPTGLTDLCFIQRWLLLGPYKQPGAFGANPGETSIRRDHLTDGAEVKEVDIEPKAGDTVNTKYGAGGARSTGLEPTLNPDLNPGGVPTWYAWEDGDDTIDFTAVYRGDENQVMAYAVTYVELEEDMVLDIGLGSDDSIQVLLDGEEIHINDVARGAGGTNAVQDLVLASSMPALNPLPRGVHRILVKVFEGNGDHAFRLRFQRPETAEGVCEGVSVCLDPGGCKGGPPPARFYRGDADSNGQLQLTDAIRILGFLFLGQAAPVCLDAADADDNGQLQLTDAIRILGFLFLGQAPPAPPGPPGQGAPCGPDPSPEAPDDLCAAYDKCGA
ncbi:MAG: hypothetical protein HY721_08060 [Planctomycetes bacterium]|nr:hypothetical protein [Planctomycetota bacterium]